jgi:hypothetical protein
MRTIIALLLVIGASAHAQEYEHWAFLADMGEEMRFHEQTRVRFAVENGAYRERIFEAGTTARCQPATFGGWAGANYLTHVCRRFVRSLGSGSVADLQMAPARGYATRRVAATTEQPKPSTSGAFRISCKPSRMGFDDPLVYWGLPGASHHHTFYGNTDVTAYLTHPHQTGRSTCTGGTVNRSAYWVPSIIDTRSGMPLAHGAMLVYYKGTNVTAPPKGLKMLSGDPHRTSPGAGYHFQCVSQGWQSAKPHIPVCAVGDRLLWKVVFPRCWDGVNLDSPDHKSHVVNVVGGVCPASHPVLLPEISFSIYVNVRRGDDTSKWRLASDHYDANLPGGYSSHADWWNGWEQRVLEQIVRECLNKSVDCHAHLIGNGQAIY